MEYISKDLAKLKFQSSYHEEYSGAAVCKLLDEVPAEDVRPVVRATWKTVGGSLRRRCSNCDYDGQEWVKFFKYCPECGAKMSDDVTNDADIREEKGSTYYNLLYEEGGMGETRG